MHGPCMNHALTMHVHGSQVWNSPEHAWKHRMYMIKHGNHWTATRAAEQKII